MTRPAAEHPQNIINDKNQYHIDMKDFNIIIVEDVPLELKGTIGIIKNDIPEAHIIGTADTEQSYFKLMKEQLPDLVLLDLGLGGSTTRWASRYAVTPRRPIPK